MTSRKGMKLILIGAVVLFVASVTATADENEDEIPMIITTDVNYLDIMIFWNEKF